MPETVSVFVHPQAKREWLEEAERIPTLVHGARLHDLKLNAGVEMPDTTEVVVVVGGDGSQRTVTRQLLAGDEDRVMLVAPGGSNNGLWRSLVDAESVVTLEQVRTGDLDHVRRFRPGIINGELFNHAAGWGDLEVQTGKEAERLSRLRLPFPRELPYILAGLSQAIPRAVFNPSDCYYRVAMMSPFLGLGRFLPQYDLYSDDVAVATVRLSSTPSLEAFFSKVSSLGPRLLEGEQPLDIFVNDARDVVLGINFERASEFAIIAADGEPFENVNVDGDVIPIEPATTLSIKRSKRALRFAALKPVG